MTFFNKKDKSGVSSQRTGGASTISFTSKGKYIGSAHHFGSSSVRFHKGGVSSIGIHNSGSRRFTYFSGSRISFKTPKY